MDRTVYKHEKRTGEKHLRRKQHKRGRNKRLILLIVMMSLVNVYLVHDIDTVYSAQIREEMNRTGKLPESCISIAARDLSSDSEDTADIMFAAIEDRKWKGPVLSKRKGVVNGPSGKETFYNLNMSVVVRYMNRLGYDYDYWVRDDGVKMFGDYVMIAANLNIRPKGTIVMTSLGPGIVCDTGGFAKKNPTQIDIATTW